jgi:hypothetical protein
MIQKKIVQIFVNKIEKEYFVTIFLLFEFFKLKNCHFWILNLVL